jgi:hypothetical protein
MKHTAVSAMSVLAIASLTGACAAPSASTGAAANNAVPFGSVAPGSSVAAVAAAPASAPATQWVIACQPYQQAQIRNTVRDGAHVAEVTCVDTPPRTVAVPAATATSALSPRAYVPVNSDVVSLDDEIAIQPRRTVRTQPAVYTVEEPERRVVRRTQPKRSWQKSAVIIGSSAGAGAGVGAIVGGKKGALIGAAIGGGSAAVWDQVTRRKD